MTTVINVSKRFDWIKSIRELLKSRTGHIKTIVRTIYLFVFSNLKVIKELERLHEKYVLVFANKICNNIVFVSHTITNVF